MNKSMAQRHAREETPFEQKIREHREQQPTTVRCAVEGCGFVREGPAIEMFELARQHRLAEHPDLRERGVNPKAKPAKPTHEQTEEDRKIVRDLVARTKSRPAAAKKRQGRQTLLTADRYADALRRYEEGDSLAGIARASFAAWGYASPAMCERAMSREMRRRGVEIRKTFRMPGRVTRLTPNRAAACRALYEAGISTSAIATLVWERYGYANENACSGSLAQRLRADGVALDRRRFPIPELNRQQALQVLDDAETPTAAAA
jgi:hypothetical protein